MVVIGYIGVSICCVSIYRNAIGLSWIEISIYSFAVWFVSGDIIIKVLFGIRLYLNIAASVCYIYYLLYVRCIYGFLGD